MGGIATPRQAFERIAEPAPTLFPQVTDEPGVAFHHIPWHREACISVPSASLTLGMVRVAPITTQSSRAGQEQQREGPKIFLSIHGLLGSHHHCSPVTSLSSQRRRRGTPKTKCLKYWPSVAMSTGLRASEEVKCQGISKLRHRMAAWPVADCAACDAEIYSTGHVIRSGTGLTALSESGSPKKPAGF